MNHMNKDERRKELERLAAIKASRRERAIWWTQHQPERKCASCGAEIKDKPSDGEGLPCGH